MGTVRTLQKYSMCIVIYLTLDHQNVQKENGWNMNYNSVHILKKPIKTMYLNISL